MKAELTKEKGDIVVWTKYTTTCEHCGNAIVPHQEHVVKLKENKTSNGYATAAYCKEHFLSDPSAAKILELY